MAGDLNENVGLGQVEAGVRHLAHEDGVHLRVVLEVLQDADPLRLGGRDVRKRSFSYFAKLFKATCLSKVTHCDLGWLKKIYANFASMRNYLQSFSQLNVIFKNFAQK